MSTQLGASGVNNRDQMNLLLDTEFADSTFWSYYFGMTGNGSGRVSVSGAGQSGALGHASIAELGRSYWPPVLTDESYRLSADVDLAAGFTGRVWIQWTYYNDSKTVQGASVTATSADYSVTPLGSATTVHLSVGGRVPYSSSTPWKYAIVDIFVFWSSTLTNAGSAAIRNVRFTRFIPDSGLAATETSVASASSLDLGSVFTHRVLITGTTTINSFGTVANQERYLTFSGALTLTYNSTSLKIPGNASLTTAAGDTAIVSSDVSGNWTVRHYTRLATAP